MTENDRQLLIDTYTAVRELRIVVIGTNGGGLVKEIEDMKSDEKTVNGRLSNIESTMMTQAKCESVRQVEDAKKRSRWMTTKDILLVAV